MRSERFSLVSIVFCLCVVTVYWACDPKPPPGEPGPKDAGEQVDSGPTNTSRRPDKDYQKTQLTEDQGCKVEISFEGYKDWPPLNERFDMLVKVSKKDGSTDGDFAIDIRRQFAGRKTSSYLATMPEHGHGMDVEPKLAPVNNHTFRVMGMLFHMRGWWEIAFQVIKGCGPTKVIFNTFVEPEEIDMKTLATDTKVKFNADEFRIMLSLSPMPELPKDPTNKYADDPKAAEFGRHLFYEKKLSLNGKGGGEVSCATCHAPDKGWSDGRDLSKGVAVLGRHSPTLWNVAYNRWMFWDGRADSLWSQAIKPMEDDKEMASNRFRILKTVVEDAKLNQKYKEVFGQEPPKELLSKYSFTDAKPMTDEDDPLHKNWASISEDDQKAINRFYTNIGKAIAAFERKIITRSSPFDTFIEGVRNKDSSKLTALSEPAQRGLKIFLRRDNCITCHSGPNFTDHEFHNIGLPVNKTHGPDTAPQGRLSGIPKVLLDIFNGVGLYSDNPDPDAPHNHKLKFLAKDNGHAVGQFKTPTLRGLTTSAPFMHDGRFKDLTAVVKFYSHFEAQDPTKCIKNGRAAHRAVPGSTIKSQPQACKLAPALLGLREEMMRLLLLSDDEIKDVVAFLESLSPSKEELKKLLVPLSEPK